MTVCTLCEGYLSGLHIANSEGVFCCHGCLAVYTILEAQQVKEGKRSHPLFQQALLSGLIAHAPLEKIESIQEGHHWTFEVVGLVCPSCATLIELVLRRLPGIGRAYVDYCTDRVYICFDPKQQSRTTIIQAIASFGYQPLLEGEIAHFSRALDWRLAIASFSALNVMMFAYPLYTTYFSETKVGYEGLLLFFSALVAMPAIFYSGWPLYRKAVVALGQGLWTMEFLVLLGVVGSLLFSLHQWFLGSYEVYFDTPAVLIAFVLWGQKLELLAKFSAKKALIQLQQALARKARKIEGNQMRFVPIETIALGDRLSVQAGERIVLDGVVESGRGACQEALLTGEITPQPKEAGDEILAGSTLESGHLIFRATSIYTNNTLQKILALAQEPLLCKSEEKGPLQRVVEFFIPAVCLLSLATFSLSVLLGIPFHEAVLRATGLLLIACPCAIGIAAPLVEAQLIQQFTERGAIVRNRTLLSLLARADLFVFDKTGTLTEGALFVKKGLESLSDGEKGVLKGLCAQSKHLIAQALDREILQLPYFFTKVIEYPGKGLAANDYWLGSWQFAKERGVEVPLMGAQMVVFFGRSSSLLAVIELEDRLRSDAKEALIQLLGEKMILSGDRQQVVDRIAKELSLVTAYGEKTPEAKQRYIQELQAGGRCVVFMGDGINDAPALSSAHVGICVARASDISIQISDLLLTRDRLTLLPELVELAKRGQKRIAQNLFWAFSYNSVGMVLAMGGWLTPIFASFAMLLSSAFVLWNARRPYHCKSTLPHCPESIASNPFSKASIG